jgi:ABC-type Fe3+ transport system substrate-binding protein
MKPVSLSFIFYLCLCFGFPSGSLAQDRLVIISPHWEGIRYEFGRGFKAFYQTESGRDVDIEWMDVGGTSEVLRFIKSEFANKPGGIDIDLMFGGGGDPYLELSRENLLTPYQLPDSLLSAIPQKVGGYPLYDETYHWYGATMAGFGIIYNKKVMKLVGLPDPKTWEDLTDPALFSWVGSADPRKSGSAHMPFEIILQAYGWERGWQIITALGANARGFANAGSQVPKDVTTGEVAYGMAIDFYAWAQINEVGEDMVGYTMPDNLTILNPDAIGIIKGAPNPQVAQSFLRFVFSEAGQRLWMQKPGTPGGPERFQLNRFTVLPEMYQRIDPAYTSVKFNPFTWTSTFVYDAEKGSQRWNIVNDLIGTFIIDAHGQLKRRWQRAIEAGEVTSVLPTLAAMPVTEEEALDLGRNHWRDQSYRNRMLLDWGKLVEQKYGTGALSIPMTELILLGGSGSLVTILIGYLWWLKRKRGE